MVCVNCGKEIRDGATFCPECGATQQGVASPAPGGESYASPTNQPAAQRAPYNMMCILGLVISGISLLLNFWGIVGIAGTVVSVIGLTSCQQKNERGKGFAIAGIAIGGFSILYGVIAILALGNILS